MRNLYFSDAVKSEQELYENLIIESIQMYGQDCYYLPRDIVNEDPILADDIPSRFNSSYLLEMYPINIDGFDGEGDLFTKFGIEIRDAATLAVSKRRWKETVYRHDNQITGTRPQEGDLLYFKMANKLFQIMHVEHEKPFYQIGNLPTYELRVELFEFNDEDFDTGIAEIDSIEQKGYRLELTLADSADREFVIGNEVSQLLGSGHTVTGEVAIYNDSDNVLTVVHIGADSGDYHTFTTGLPITSTDVNGDSLTRTVTAINEQLNTTSAQNEDFEDIDFLDFSENNPFGNL